MSPQITPGPIAQPTSADPITPGHDYSTGYPPIGPGGMHTGYGQPRKSNKRRNIMIALAALAILLLGVGIGSAGKPAATPAPAPEVRTETVTKEVKVYRTPPACLTALDLNEAAFTYSAEAMQAIVNGDYKAAGAATTKIKGITPQAQQAKADCRAANQ